MKKISSFILSLIMVLGILTSVPVTANAASVDVLHLVLKDDGASYYLHGCNSYAQGEIVIPETYKGLPVTSISSWAFGECRNITSIKIPDSVTDIGTAAFEGCSKLESITLPKGLKSIEGQTFYDCKSLASITIPDSVTSIGNAAFQHCGALTSLTFPDSLNSINSNAFYGCSRLEEINVSSGNTAFWSDNGVLYNKDKTTIIKYPEAKISKSYEILDSVTSIGDWAFESCTKLESISIPDGVSSIGSQAFAFCRNLSECSIPASVKSIGDVAFRGCSSITSFETPEGVTTIESQTFYDCSSLESITIPDTVTSIGENAFSGCRSLTDITIPEGVVIIDREAFSDCTGFKEIKLPDSVTTIGDYAFGGCANLKSFTIANGVTSMGYNPFRDCTNLAEINVGSKNTMYSSNNGVLFNKDKTTLLQYPINKADSSYEIPTGTNIISDEAFRGCENLESVVIPDSVTEIGSDAFYGCSNLTAITVPDSVSYIGMTAFYGTGYYNDESNWENNVLYMGKHLVSASRAISGACSIKPGTKTISGHAFRDCSELTSIDIPDSVVCIGNTAFNGCTSLTSVEIPDSVKVIEYQAFMNCTSLTSVKLSKNLESLGECIFGCCEALTTIEIPEGMECIRDAMFYDCANLESIKIPVSVTKIEREAFLQCGSLSDVYFDGTAKQWEKIEIEYGNEDLLNAKVHYFCDHPSTKWVTDKKATVNAAGKKHKECTECGETLEIANIPQLKCSKPKLKSIENTEYGVLTKWSSVSGADKYDVYRKTGSSGKYSKIGTTSKTYYTDKKASSGKKYYYYVKAVNEAGSSEASSSLSKYYLADTTLSTPKSTKSGITLKWSKITGADGYMVYRKTGSGSYSKIATVKGSTKVTYTDKTAKKGKKYTYKIKAYKSKTYSAYSNTKTIKDKY